MESLEMKTRAMVGLLVGTILYFTAWSLLPREPYFVHSIPLLQMAVLMGAVVSFGRVKGALAWLIGVLVAFLVNKAAYSFWHERGDTVEYLWVSALWIITSTYVGYCLAKHRACNRAVVMTSLVAMYMGMTADFLFQPSFWRNLGAVPPFVLASWLVAFISGIVLGYSLLLHVTARPQHQRP